MDKEGAVCVHIERNSNIFVIQQEVSDCLSFRLRERCRASIVLPTLLASRALFVIGELIGIVSIQVDAL